MECDKDTDTPCDILDSDFPIEEALIPVLIELVVKVLSGVKYQPADRRNNAQDDLAQLALFLRHNTKGDLQKALDMDD